MQVRPVEFKNLCLEHWVTSGEDAKSLNAYKKLHLK